MRCDRQGMRLYLYQYRKAAKRREEIALQVNQYRDGRQAPAHIRQAFSAQNQRAADAETAVFHALDRLPEFSVERMVLEMRFLDCRPWKEIERAIGLSHSPIMERQNNGLDCLLRFPEIRQAVRAFDPPWKHTAPAEGA